MAELIDIYLTSHAQKDCIPLRFGFVPLYQEIGSLEAEFDETGTKNQKPHEQKEGNKHYFGKLTLNSGKLITDAVFVVGSDARSNYKWQRARYPVISIMTRELGSRGVSDLIRSFRMQERMTPDFIAKELHPLYADQRLKTEMSFFEALVKIGISKNTKDLKAELTAAEKKAEANSAEFSQFREKVAKIRESDVSGKNRFVERTPRRLIDVKPNVEHRGSICTQLEFDDGPCEYMKVETFDKDLAITKKAATLIKKMVVTYCWDPVDQPGLWSKKNYFLDVLEAPER